MVGSYPVCPRGCTACSRVNGCITCEGRLFMFLYRHNMRETGICTPSCPVGYYGVRHQYYSKCYRCHMEHCHSCFDRNFCSLCEEPYLASQGQCIQGCPGGLFYANYTRECKDRVDCVLGPWSPWSECTRNGQTCGYRWGTQTRGQPILQEASPNGQACPEMTDTQRCRLRRRQCDGRCSGRKKPRRKNKHRGRGRKDNGRPGGGPGGGWGGGPGGRPGGRPGGGLGGGRGGRPGGGRGGKPGGGPGGGPGARRGRKWRARGNRRKKHRHDIQLKKHIMVGC